MSAKIQTRLCPGCHSNDIRSEKQSGLCVGNIWVDLICNKCGHEWEKGSKVDKLSKRN